MMKILTADTVMLIKTEKIKTLSIDLVVIAIFGLIGALITSHLWHSYGGQSLSFGNSEETLAYADNSQFTSNSPEEEVVVASANPPDPNSGCGCPGCCAVSVL